VEDGHKQRRSREDYEELDRLLTEADGSLVDEDLRGANEMLKKAGVKATSMWGEVGRPVLPGHVRALVSLLWDVQEDLARANGTPRSGSRRTSGIYAPASVSKLAERAPKKPFFDSLRS
jgi:hypothetical protein